MDYDMVFTSPPYYNKEIYGGNIVYETKEEWDKKFYIPLFKKTWDNLKVGGFYCLNVPVCIYNKICIILITNTFTILKYLLNIIYITYKQSEG